jgi:cation diffusion facilitator family transporter
LSDLISDGLILAFLKLSYQPPTRRRPYGNRKLESFASLFVGGILVAVVVSLVWNSIHSRHETAIDNLPALIVVIISIVSKEALFRYTIRSGRKLKSPALIANAWHHRSDALSSVMVLFCLLMGRFFGNIKLWDMAGVAMVAIMILHAVWEIVRGSFKELLDHAPSEETLDAIEKIVDEDSDVTFLYDVKSRTIGGCCHISFTVEIDGGKTVNEANRIVERVKQNIFHQITDILTVAVQVCPSGELSRKVTEQGWDEITDDALI